MKNENTFYASLNPEYAQGYAEMYYQDGVNINDIGIIRLTVKNNSGKSVIEGQKIRINDLSDIIKFEEETLSKEPHKHLVYNQNSDNVSKVVDENGDPVYEEDGVTPKTEEVEGTLLSPDDKKKLDALVIGEEGVEISGKVNAANVEGLSEWVTTNRDKVAGLYSTTTDSKVNKAIADLATLTTAVDTNTTNITAVNTRVDDVITSLTAYVQSIEYNAKMAAIDTDIDTLKDALTWKVIATE